MPSVVGTDLKIVGDLVCKGDIDVQGVIEGKMQAQNVVVSEGAGVKGTIQAQSLEVSGTVEGGVEASSLSLTNTAAVSGEIVHETMSVEPGARLEAQVSRIKKEDRVTKLKVAKEPKSAA